MMKLPRLSSRCRSVLNSDNRLQMRRVKKIVRRLSEPQLFRVGRTISARRLTDSVLSCIPDRERRRVVDGPWAEPCSRSVAALPPVPAAALVSATDFGDAGLASAAGPLPPSPLSFCWSEGWHRSLNSCSAWDDDSSANISKASKTT